MCDSNNNTIHIGNEINIVIDDRFIQAYRKAYGPKDSALKYIDSLGHGDFDSSIEDGKVELCVKLAEEHGKTRLSLTRTGKELISQLEDLCEPDGIKVEPYTKGTISTLISRKYKFVYYPVGTPYIGPKYNDRTDPVLVVRFSI